MENLAQPEKRWKTAALRVTLGVFALANIIAGAFLVRLMFMRLDLDHWFDANFLKSFIAVIVIFDAIWIAVYGWPDSTRFERLLRVSGSVALLLAVSVWLTSPLFRPRSGGFQIPSDVEYHFPRNGGPLSDPPFNLPDLSPTPIPTPSEVPASPPPGGTIEEASTAPHPSAYWNTWFEYDNKPAPEDLTVGNTYTFTVDISPYEYEKLRANAVQSSAVDQTIEKILADPKVEQLEFQIRPLLPEGGGLSFGSQNQLNITPLTADLHRIRNPKDAEAQRYLADEISLHDFSDTSAAGSLRFEIRTDKAGCAAVILSIFSKDGRFPLDHLVRMVAIAKPGEAPPACGVEMSGGRQQQYAGLDQLLRVALELDSAGTSQVADAAFHIFDTPAGSFVVFSDGRSDQSKSIYAWQTLNSLGSYVRNELPMLINSARDDAANGKPGSYVTAANELADKIFTGKGSGEEEASAAKKAFQELVAQSPKRPTVIARVISDIVLDQNRSVFVPLGILGAEGEGAVLKQPITVIQPLPRERYSSKSSCVDEWTFGMPSKLRFGRLPAPEDDLSNFWPPNKSAKNRISNLEDLRSYLSNTAPADDQAGQGFLLLAHHGNGHLWFEEEAQRVVVENVKRNFPSGSVGVFAACSVATVSYDAGFVQRLNERGIDTLIASPFPVPAEFGVVLAAEFPQAVETVRSRSGKPTMSDLFDVAIARAITRVEGENKRNYKEMSVEYVLLGNPYTSICKKPQADGKP
jgi:hypothetical protein